MKKSINLFAAAMFALLTAAHADTHTWSGAAITSNWSTPANWVGNNPPYAGEPAPVSIIFPTGALRPVNYCNIANLAVDEIIFKGNGYFIGSAAPGTALTLNSTYLTITCSAVNDTLAVPLVLNTTNLSFVVSGGYSLHLSGALSGPGNFIKMGKGDLYLEGAADNTFTEATVVVGGTLHLGKTGGALAFSGPLIVGNTNGPAYVGQSFDSIVQMEADQQMGFGTAVTINPDAELYLNNHNLAVGSLTMVGNSYVTEVSTNKGTLTLLGNFSAPRLGDFTGNPYINCKLSLGATTRTFDIDSSLQMDGVISSGGNNAGIIKTGIGSLVLNGDSIYTGQTTINEGSIHCAGSVPNSPFVVQPDAYLQGSGLIGTVNSQGGFLYFYSASALKSKDVTLDNTSTFTVLLQGYQTPTTPAFLTVTGAVNLGNCQLVRQFNTNSTFDPGIGTQFMLIQNDGNDPVNGIFAGLPEGTKFKFGGRQWQITYQGGTGNDVMLTLLSAQLPFSTDSLVISPADSQMHIYGTGAPGVIYELHSSTNLTTWSKVQKPVFNNNGVLDAIDSSWNPSIPQCFYRFYQP